MHSLYCHWICCNYSDFKNLKLSKKIDVISDEFSKKNTHLSEVLTAAHLDPNVVQTGTFHRIYTLRFQFSNVEKTLITISFLPIFNKHTVTKNLDDALDSRNSLIQDLQVR